METCLFPDLPNIGGFPYYNINTKTWKMSGNQVGREGQGAHSRQTQERGQRSPGRKEPKTTGTRTKAGGVLRQRDENCLAGHVEIFKMTS